MMRRREFIGGLAGSSAEFREFRAKEILRWTKVVQAAGTKGKEL